MLKLQMTPNMTWVNMQIDLVKPICMFGVSSDEELREGFSWKNTQAIIEENHYRKGTKFNLLDYQIQFIKACHFLELNKE